MIVKLRFEILGCFFDLRGWCVGPDARRCLQLAIKCIQFLPIEHDSFPFGKGGRRAGRSPRAPAEATAWFWSFHAHTAVTVVCLWRLHLFAAALWQERGAAKTSPASSSVARSETVHLNSARAKKMSGREKLTYQTQ
jgi:hypothetical protein